jgi:hypothetical protein
MVRTTGTEFIPSQVCLLFKCCGKNRVSVPDFTVYAMQLFGTVIYIDYYLFKKFLVSDWLTANCEIVIST